MKLLKSKLYKTVRMNVIEKISGMAAGFIRVPMLLGYLGTEKYGFIVLMLTICNWLLFSDFGFGYSLKNSISKYRAEENEKEILHLIRYCVTVLSLFCLIVLIICSTIIYKGVLLDFWGKYNFSSSEINLSAFIMLILYIPMIPLSLGRNIYYIYGKGETYSLFMAVSQILNILALYIAIQLKAPIYMIIFWNYFFGVFIQLILLIAFAYFKFNTINLFCSPFGKEKIHIINLGMKFFILQIVSLVINQTDNIIIERFSGMSQISIYSVCIQLYNAGLVLVTVLSETLWTNYADHFNNKETEKLKHTFNMHKKISYIYGLAAVSGYIILAKPFIKIWTHGKIVPPTSLIVVIGLLFLFKILNGPLVTFLNALNILDKQILPSIINAVLNLILSVVFVKMIGVTGVALGTLIPFVVFSVGVDWYLCCKSKDNFPLNG